MKKKSSIVKLSIIGVVLIIGLVFSFCSLNIGLTTFKSTTSAIKLGLDLKGGVYAVYEMAETEDTSNLSSRMDGTRKRLENLLNKKGYTEATVVREGQTRLRVEVPDVDEPGKIFDIIGKPATLRFELDETKKVVLTGEDIVSAVATYQEGKPVVALTLTDAGAEAFSNATKDNIGKTMSIISTVDGDDTTISSPKINSQIANGKAIIDGMQSQEAAQELADQITSGQFEVKLSLLESNTVSPTLGDKALTLGLIAGIVGLILVMLFLCLIYRGLGGVASVSLLLYTALMFFFLAVVPGVQLTLPGIAGIILSLGMAVDANIIIYERMKDEYRDGKSILAASHLGFKRATSAIVDSNITTIIAGVVLLIFGTGSVQGFAITLLIGIVLSMFSSLFITRKLVKYVVSLAPDKPKFFNFKRGAQNANLAATDSTPGTDDELKTPKKTKKNIGSTEGGAINENI